MNAAQYVIKPKKRTALRSYIGKLYFRYKRHITWLISNSNYAKIINDVTYTHNVKLHQSILLRPLANVDMQLQYNKIINLGIAIQCLNKVVILPGQTLSLWKLIGNPTTRKGYLDGLTLSNGHVTNGTGGGLCQLGNLVYWLALHTPLTVTERWRHSYDVFPDVHRSIPFACGATLAYNYIDLQLKNETSHHFQLNLWLDDVYLHGSFVCNLPLHSTYEIHETDHCFTQQWWGGYTRHNKIWKTITNLITGEVTTELIAVNNAIMMYNPLLH